MRDVVEQDKVRAMHEARKAVEAGMPDTPIQISALALYQLAHTIVRQQGEIESLLLDRVAERRETPQSPV
jgi:HAMP domain-containing protein